MFKKLLFGCLALLTSLIVLPGCKDGEVGPQGPAGPAGPTGATGGTGQTGQTGSANVIYSDWITIPATATASTKARKNFTISAPQITDAIRDNGLIYVYLRYSTNGVTPLPYAGTFVYNDPNRNDPVLGSYLTTFLVATGSFSINQDWLTPGVVPDAFANSTSIMGGFTHVRYVIIPGAVKTSMKPGVNLKDYNEVAKYFNIPL